MLYEIMRHLRNFFVYETIKDTFVISDGVLNLDELTNGTYFLIEGSLLNDGVYVAPTTLKNETFFGVVAILHPPKEFIDLSTEISTFCEKNVETPFTSESFGGYSYSKATNKNGNLVGWKDVFKQRLDVWRKL